MSERTDNIATITELAVACTIFAPCLEEPPDYPAYIDDETGAKAEVDRLATRNDDLSSKVEVTEDLYDALADDIEELQRENDELRTELDKRKEAGSSGGKTRYSDTSNRKDGRNVDVDARNSDRDTGADRAGVVPLGQTEAMTYEVTAYTAGAESTGKNPGDTGHGMTASGATVSEGTTLACPPSLDFGTVVHIDGIGERVCEDRGADITDGRLDVYMDDLERAQEFGRKSTTVNIIRKGER